MTTATTDYYAILGISQTSTLKEIARAYRSRALQLHPDKNLDNKEADRAFTELNHAYNVLCNPQTRAAHDEQLNARMKRQRRFDSMDSARKRMRAGACKCLHVRL